MDQSRRGTIMGLGLIVITVGTVSNIGEFSLAMGIRQGVLIPIVLLALLDAAFIAYFFMHITQLWHSEE